MEPREPQPPREGGKAAHRQSPQETQPAAEPQSTESERPSPTTQKVEGKFEELKGRAKQAGGAIIGDSGTKVKGQAEEIKGRFKQKLAGFRQKLRKKI